MTWSINVLRFFSVDTNWDQTSLDSAHPPTDNRIFRSGFFSFSFVTLYYVLWRDIFSTGHHDTVDELLLPDKIYCRHQPRDPEAWCEINQDRLMHRHNGCECIFQHPHHLVKIIPGPFGTRIQQRNSNILFDSIQHSYVYVKMVAGGNILPHYFQVLEFC